MRQIMMLSSVLLLSACLHGTHSQDWSAYPLNDNENQKANSGTDNDIQFISCNQPYPMTDGTSYPKPQKFASFEDGISHLNALSDFFDRPDYYGEIPILCLRYTLGGWPTVLESRQNKADIEGNKEFPTRFFLWDPNNFLGNFKDSLDSDNGKLFTVSNLKKSTANQAPWLDNKSLAVMPILASSYKIEKAYAYYEEKGDLDIPAFDIEKSSFSNDPADRDLKKIAYNLSLLWPEEFPKTFQMTMVLADLTQISITTDGWAQITVSIKHQDKKVQDDQFLIVAQADRNEAKLTEFKAWLKNIKNLAPAEKGNLKLLQDWLKDHESLFED